MGSKFMDAYSLLHFAVGVVVRHWGMSFLVWTIIHTLFEVVENTEAGMRFINTCVKMWPGGKPSADSLSNSVGDSVFAALGWLAADLTLTA